MRLPARALVFGLGLVTAVAVAACSSSGGSVATVRPIPTPTPTPSAPVVTGNITCTAPNSAVPGSYISIQTGGGIVGSTYTQTVSSAYNSYANYSYTAPGATPAPVQTPIPFPSPNTGTNPVVIIEYFGEYSLALTQASGFSASPVTGCFELLSANGESIGGGAPVFATPQPSSTLANTGSLTTFTITNVTPSSGTGSFTLDNGQVGTVTITGSETETLYFTPAAIHRSPNLLTPHRRP